MGPLCLLFQADHAQVGHLDCHRILRVPLLARAAALHASNDDGFHAMEQYSGKQSLCHLYAALHHSKGISGGARGPARCCRWRRR